MDTFRNIISKLSGGGTPLIDQTLANHFQQRRTAVDLAKAQLQQKANEKVQADASGADPDTINRIIQEYDIAEQNYEKAAGIGKESKPIVQQTLNVLRHVIRHPSTMSPDEQQQQPGARPATTQAPPAGQAQAPVTAAPPDGSVPPPPASPQAASPQAAQPSFKMQALGAPLRDQMLKSQVQAQAEAALEQAKKTSDVTAVYQGLVKSGFQPEEARAIVKAKVGGVGVRPRTHPVWITDPSDPTRRIPGVQDMMPDANNAYPVHDYTGALIDNPSQLLPTMLPTQSGTSSTYDPNTGTTKTARTSQKLAPGGKAARPATTTAPPSGGAPSSPAATGRIATMAQAWSSQGTEPSAKDKPYVEQYMQANGMQPTVKPTATEVKLRDDLKKVEPMVDRLQNFLEQNKLTDAGQGGMLSPGAWWEKSKVTKAWQEYSHGLPPKDKQLGELIKMASAIKIMGAAPWMSLGRGKFLYSEVVKHLPNETDTPAQLYEKVQFYRDVLEDAKGSLPPSLTGGGNAPASTSTGSNPYR